MKPHIACAIALCIALPVQAQTYKWVDDKGVTNYSTTPPAGKASKAKVVEDQISVVPTDPDFERQAEGLRKREARRAADQAKADAQRRQQQAAAPQPPPPPPADIPIDDEWWYGGGYGGYYPWRPVVRPPRPTHPIARPGRPVQPDMPLTGAQPAPSRR